VNSEIPTIFADATSAGTPTGVELPAPSGASVSAVAGAPDPLWPLAVESVAARYERPRVVAQCVLCKVVWFEDETPRACGEEVCPLERSTSDGACAVLGVGLSSGPVSEHPRRTATGPLAQPNDKGV